MVNIGSSLSHPGLVGDNLWSFEIMAPTRDPGPENFCRHFVHLSESRQWQQCSQCGGGEGMSSVCFILDI